MTLHDGISIIGVGHFLPLAVQNNDELCQKLSVTPEWIIEKTGIKRRRIAGPGDLASEYSLRAATQAICMAGLSPDAIDLTIVCTFSADYIFPSMASKLHRDLHATGGQTFDLQANCAGFVSGLTAASDRMKLDRSVRHALVVGAEFNTRYVNQSDSNTAIYLSDGAGAVVLGRTEAGSGVGSSAFFTDSSNYDSVRVRYGGSSFRRFESSPSPEVEFMEINGIATWKQAITHLPRVIRQACEKSNVSPKDVDLIILHQANLRLIEYIMQKMGYPMSRTFTNVQEIGNTGAASVAIALSEAVSMGHLKPGDVLVLAAVGAGFNFGASVWRWTLPKRDEAL